MTAHRMYQRLSRNDKAELHLHTRHAMPYRQAAIVMEGETVRVLPDFLLDLCPHCFRVILRSDLLAVCQEHS